MESIDNFLIELISFEKKGRRENCYTNTACRSQVLHLHSRHDNARLYLLDKPFYAPDLGPSNYSEN
jgi:hypothetical protein